MSGCECAEARAKLEELIRGELCASDSAPIREHLAGCDSCRDEEQVCQRLTAAVQRACRAPAPDSLRDTIQRELQRLHSTAD